MGTVSCLCVGVHFYEKSSYRYAFLSKNRRRVNDKGISIFSFPAFIHPSLHLGVLLFLPQHKDSLSFFLPSPSSSSPSPASSSQAFRLLLYLLLFLQKSPRNILSSRSKAKPFFAAQPDAWMISNSPCVSCLDVGHVYGVNYSWSNRWWNIILFLVVRSFSCWLSVGLNASLRRFCCEKISFVDAGGIEWEIPGSWVDSTAFLRISTHHRSSPSSPNSIKYAT